MSHLYFATWLSTSRATHETTRSTCTLTTKRSDNSSPASNATPEALFPIFSENAAQLCLRPGVHNLFSTGCSTGAHSHVKGGIPGEAEAPVCLVHLQEEQSSASVLGSEGGTASMGLCK